MKDQILEKYVLDFKDEKGIIEHNFDKIFEHFVNDSIVSKLYPRELNYEDLSTGGGDDIGLDGAAIIVNGNIITDENQIDFFINSNGSIEVTFALIQSKTSPKFRADHVGTLIFGIKSFFDDRPSIPENSQITKLRKVKDKVFNSSLYFQENPTLKIYFATSGTWAEPAQITGRVEREIIST
ncbi:MAG: hypothetical protein AB4372_24645 [Xenococcus sp. (in: cyanobacteria)]